VELLARDYLLRHYSGGKTWSAFGLWLPKGMAAAQTISYMTFYKGGLLFFLVTIATANYAWFNSRTSQS